MVGQKGGAITLKILVHLARCIVLTLAACLPTDAAAGKSLAKNLTNADDTILALSLQPIFCPSFGKDALL